MTVETAPHGTYARYQQERKQGRPACDECRAAAAAYTRQHRAQSPLQRAKDRAYSRAYNTALQRLARLHQADFTRLLDEEIAKNADPLATTTPGGPR